MSSDSQAQGEKILAEIRRQPPDLTPPSIPPSSFRGSMPNRHIIQDWTQTKWAQSSLLREFVSTCIIWGLALLIWIVLYSTPVRQTYSFTAPPSLDEATETWLAGDATPWLDDVTLLLRSTLPIYYEFNPPGAPFRFLLKGIYAEKLLGDADNYFQSKEATIKAQGIHQTFEMEPLSKGDLVEDKKTSRYSVSVRGHLVMRKDSVPNAAPLIIPYSFKVVLSRNTPSRINTYKFFVEDIRR